MNGTDVKWRMKPTGKDSSHMFRSYDRNEIVMSGANFTPSADASKVTAFEKFDYDPSWTIEITENGKKLSYEVVKVKDPLHLIAYEAKRYNANANPTSSFNAYTISSHMFRVKASSASSTIEIKVTDRFGNSSSESMKRPKAFSLNAYK